MQKQVHLYGNQAEQITEMLSIPKEDRDVSMRLWALYGPPWNNKYEIIVGGKNRPDNKKLHKEIDEGFYPQLGQLLFSLFDKIELQNKTKILM